MIKRIFIIISLFLFSLPCFSLTIYSGTGFFIAHNGYIATAYHVIDTPPGHLFVSFGGKDYSAKVIASDKSNDAAILKIDYKNTMVFPLQEEFTAGDVVGGYGFPLNWGFSYTPMSASKNIKKNYLNIGDKYIFAGMVCHGHSGGPVVTDKGAVIGFMAGIYAFTNNQCGIIAYITPVRFLIALAQKNNIPIVLSDETTDTGQKNPAVVKVFTYVNN